MFFCELSMTLCLIYETKCFGQSSDTIRYAFKNKLSTCSLHWDPSDIYTKTQTSCLNQTLKLAGCINHTKTSSVLKDQGKFGFSCHALILLEAWITILNHSLYYMEKLNKRILLNVSFLIYGKKVIWVWHNRNMSKLLHNSNFREFP